MESVRRRRAKPASAPGSSRYARSIFERFTERARQVVVLAQDEARAFRHNYIGTEHILLGLLREEHGLAARVLDSFSVTVEETRAQVARIVGQGDEVMTGQIPFTPRAKKVLELSPREALSLGHNYIGTEHILLGLGRENEGVAARILLDFDADAERIRNEVIGMLSAAESPEAREAASWGQMSAQLNRREMRRRMREVRARARIPPPLIHWPGIVVGAAVFAAGLVIGWLIWG